MTVSTSHDLLSLKIDQPNLGIEREYFVKGLEDKIVQAYHNYHIETAVFYGANRTHAEAEIEKVLEFEMSLAKVMTHLTASKKKLSMNRFRL